DERALVRGHLADCAACRAELADLQAAVSALPLELDEMTPPPALRDRIEAAVLTDLAAGGTAVAANGAQATGRFADAGRPHARTDGTATPPPADAVADDRTALPTIRPRPVRVDEPMAAPTPVPLRQPRRLGGGWLAAAA